MSALLFALAVAVPVGLTFAAAHASLYRRRMRRLEAILAVLATMPGGANTSVIADAVGCSVPSLYPDLARLEQDGRVASDWVDGPFPRRRRYWVTMKGYSR
jgi:hypothetical protein